MADLTEEEELELLELENANAKAQQAAAQQEKPQGVMSAAGQALSETMTEDLAPGGVPIGEAVGAIRSDIPGAIAEKAGELGEKIGGGVGDYVRGTGVGLAGTIGMAGEMLPKTGLDLAAGVVLPGMGRMLGKAGAALLPPLESRAPNIIKAVRAAVSADILPTVAQITQSKPVAAMEEVISKIPFFGRRVEAMRSVQDGAFNELRSKVLEKAGAKVAPSELGAATTAAISDDLARTTAAREEDLATLHRTILDKNGPATTREQIGQQLDEIRVAKTEEARKTAGKLYEEAESAIPAERNQVFDANTRAAAERTLKKYENVPTASLDPKARKLLEDLKSGPGDKIIENAADPVQALDPQLLGGAAEPEVLKVMKERKAYTFSEMQTMRETLNGMIQQERLKVPPGQMTPEGRIYKQLKQAVDDDIESFSNGLPGDVKRKFDVATAYYRDKYKGVYANDTIATLGRIAQKDPENVYRMVIKPGDVSDIRRVKKVVGEEGFKPLRRQFMEDLVTGPGGEILSGHDIAKNMSKFGVQTLREILTPEQLKQVVRYAETRELPRFVESQIEKKLRSVIIGSKGVYNAPEQVVEKIINGDVATARAVQRIVGKEGMAPYKRRIVEGIIGEPPAPTALPGQVQTPSSMRIGKNLQAYDEKFLGELFSKDELAQIERIDDLKALLESQQRLAANASGTASSIIAPAAGGGLGALYVVNTPLAVKLTITADIFSRMITSESGRKLLLKGLDPKFAGNAELAGHIAAYIERAAMERVNEDRANKGLKPVEVKR